MLKSLGNFQPYLDNRRKGDTFKNADGLDWHRFVMRRTMFDDFGNVIELYDTNDNPIEGDRFFCAVKDGVVVSVANRDISLLMGLLPAEIVETDIQVSEGWLFTGRGFKAPPPPPIVVHKAQVVGSFTDEQHEDWAENYPEATPKQRNTWENFPSFIQGTEEYLTAQSLLVGLFGPEGYNFFPK